MEVKVIMEVEDDDSINEIYADKLSDYEDELYETNSDSHSDTDNDALIQFKQKNFRQIISDSEYCSSVDTDDDNTNAVDNTWTRYDSKRELEMFLGDPSIKTFPNNFQGVSEVAGLLVMI